MQIQYTSYIHAFLFFNWRSEYRLWQSYLTTTSTPNLNYWKLKMTMGSISLSIYLPISVRVYCKWLSLTPQCRTQGMELKESGPGFHKPDPFPVFEKMSQSVVSRNLSPGSYVGICRWYLIPFLLFSLTLSEDVSMLLKELEGRLNRYSSTQIHKNAVKLLHCSLDLTTLLK